MADQNAPQMKSTLGLTGLTSNAMALIAPGAFLWLTFFIQATTGTTAPAMWLGIFGALLLCLATAVAYAEISKLYPGTGSSYYYAEQALLSKVKMFKYARIAKFIVGWGSHLYYWVYPGVMVATTGIFVGYVVGFLYPSVMSGSNPGPLFMALVAIAFSFFVGWIASKGAGASTAVNLAINVIQISALILFSFLAIGYRTSHPAGSPAFQYDGQTLATYDYQFATAKDGSTVRDSSGAPMPLLDSSGKKLPFTINYPEKDASGNFLTHPTAMSVIAPHKFSFLFIQATVAILILVGFESVTAMGGEAKNPTRHIPIAVIASLLIQGLVCYLIEYFAANYFLNSGYTMASASSSAAPIGDMMIIVGDGLLGHGNGRYFMLAEALTVFLALIGTTLSCMNTGARVTYAMGKDDEAPEHFGILHAKSLSPRKAIWTLAVHLRRHRRHRRFAGLRRCRRAHRCGHHRAATRHLFQLGLSLPRSVGRAAQLAAHHHAHLQLRHLHSLRAQLLPVHRGLPQARTTTTWSITCSSLASACIANLVCMAFYLISPVFGLGTFKEPLLALGISAVWGIYGAIYFLRSSKTKGKAILLESR